LNFGLGFERKDDRELRGSLDAVNKQIDLLIDAERTTSLKSGIVDAVRFYFCRNGFQRRLYYRYLEYVEAIKEAVYSFCKDGVWLRRSWRTIFGLQVFTNFQKI